MTTIVCENCNTHFEHNKRGRKPKLCENCKKNAVSDKQKPKKTEKNIICNKCSKEFIHNKRGRAPLSCPECREAAIKKLEPKIREFTCVVCGNTYNHMKRGRLPKICNTCKDTKPKEEIKNVNPKYKEVILYEVVEKKTKKRLMETVFNKHARASSIAEVMGFDCEFEVLPFVVKRRIKDAEN